MTGQINCDAYHSCETLSVATAVLDQSLGSSEVLGAQIVANAGGIVHARR